MNFSKALLLVGSIGLVLIIIMFSDSIFDFLKSFFGFFGEVVDEVGDDIESEVNSGKKKSNKGSIWTKIWTRILAFFVVILLIFGLILAGIYFISPETFKSIVNSLMDWLCYIPNYISDLFSKMF